MKFSHAVFIGIFCAAVGVRVSPVQQVLSLLRELQATITANGEKEAATYEKYKEFCTGSSKDTEFAIQTASTEIEQLSASINKAAADIGESNTKVERLGAALSTNDANLKDATKIRDEEGANFLANEKELMDSVDTLDRAINILERKLKGSAMLQANVDTKDISKMVSALTAVVDAASLAQGDKQKLMALTQASASSSAADTDDLSDAELGAPAAEAYKSHSKNIVDVLEDLRETARQQLSDARKAEATQKHNYNMMKQNLEDQMAADNKGMSDAKSAKASAQEEKAVAEGDLVRAQTELADAKKALEELTGGCTTAASDHEASVKSLAEEKKALAAAIQAVSENTGGAESRVYNGAASFLQLNDGTMTGLRLSTSSDLANFEVVNLVRQLAKKEKSAALNQLASQIASAMKYASASGEDPFAKVKGMIMQMINTLEQQASKEANHKSYCDKEMADTATQVEELTASKESLGAKLMKKDSALTKLKGEVQDLQGELAELAKMQANMDQLRKAQKEEFVKEEADLTKGLNGVRMALGVLKEYYGAALLQQAPEKPEYHSKSGGAGSGIIGMLQVIESDFGKSLAEASVAEDSAAGTYEKQSQENRVSTAIKKKDVEYKQKEIASLAKGIAELKSDKDQNAQELDAVLKYQESLDPTCVGKASSYEERKARREAEVTGLREALKILNGEALLQRRTRGIARHFG